MGRRGITREAVERVHDALVTAGLTPSVRTVREKLGDTGSLTTIAEHLRAIHLERQEGPGPALPDPIARKLLDGASDFWRDLSSAADQIVDDIRTAAAADVAAARTERDEARASAVRAREELGARQATLDTLERHLAETTARLERAEAALVEAGDARGAAEERARSHGNERDALERDLAAARAESIKQEARRDEERAAHRSRLETIERDITEARIAHQSERDGWVARLEERETERAEIATALAHSEERARLLDGLLGERVRERDGARGDAKALRAQLRLVTEARDALAAERAASARERETSALLEQLLADDRTGRVLTLLESIDARVGEVRPDPPSA